ncbi:MAG TPA: N-acetylmuramoyl-L-alanine amidase [Vicinamibacterales bacterium]|nr:N-acetylmuramoyl-L-alanine amidase [Vicinamibacterales bacterium]
MTRSATRALLTFVLAAGWWLAAPAHAQRPAARQGQAAGRAQPQQVREVQRSRLSEAVRITIVLEHEAPYRSERLDNPARLVFDFVGTRPGPALVEGTLSYYEDLVRYVRIGRHPNDVTRVVLDLTGVQRYSVFALYDPFRLVVDCVRPPAAPTARAAAAPAAPAPPSPPAPPASAAPPPQRLEERALATPPEAEPAEVVMFSRRLREAFVPLAEAPAPAPVPVPEAEPTPADAPAPGTAKPTDAETRKPAAPAARPVTPGAKPATPLPLKGGFSLARQLGLGATRIVIDPGHGGRDPGAQGRGATEAGIVLDIALRLEKLLKAAGLEVVLTRRTNEYVSLEERTAIANRAQGDLFLSIHANASRNTRAQGVETYVLNFASNPEAEAVAARENASGERTMSSLNTILQAIALNNKLDESRGFAAQVQGALVKRLRATHKQLRDLGVKQAPFVVLIGAEMPSVLVEVSFITHLQEGRLLKTASYRQKVAEALSEGIRGYQKSLKQALTVSRERE